MKIQLWVPKVYVPLLVAHLVVLATAPARVLSWSYGFVLIILAFTLVLCVRRLRFSVIHNRPLWLLLLLALVVQCAAFALLFSDSLVHPQGTLVAFDPTFYFCLGSLLLTIAAAYSPVGTLYRWAGIVDGVLACVIVGLFYELLRRVIGQGSADTSTATFVMWMFDAIALFVAVFVTLRFVVTKRRFYFVLLMFSWAELIFPAIHNRYILTSESYVPELCLDLPFVVVGMLLSQRRTVWFRGFRPKRRMRIIAGSVSPFILSAALCLLALGYLGRSSTLAIGALILGIASYALRVAMVLGRHLALEDELKDLQRGLQQTVVRDDLTGLMNRRGFYRIFNRAWEVATTAGTPLTIALMDIDMFKTYNDTYGHLAGNDCLAKVSRALEDEAHTHSGATVARYGGEEFAILIADCDRATSEHILQRLRLSVEALQIQNVRSPHRVVTVSAGLAITTDAHYADMENLLQVADTALYAAKRAGRNCIRWFDPGGAALQANQGGLSEGDGSRSL